MLWLDTGDDLLQVQSLHIMYWPTKRGQAKFVLMAYGWERYGHMEGYIVKEFAHSDAARAELARLRLCLQSQANVIIHAEGR